MNSDFNRDGESGFTAGTPRGQNVLAWKWPRAIAALALAATSLGWLTACSTSEADPRIQPPVVRVTTIKSSVEVDRSFTGVISARVQSDLGFRVGGKVVERLVDTGAVVKKGQPLMRIDRADLDLALTAQLHTVAADRARAEQAASEEARYHRLLGTETISQQTYDQAKAAADSLQADLAAAEAQAELLKKQVDYSVLLADTDGVVVETQAEPGQVVTAGQIVVRLAHAGPREAVVSLPEGVRPHIGSPARAALYGGSDKIYAAHLRQLSDSADPQTRTYEARFVLDGTGSDAPLGGTVTVTVPFDEAADPIEVPLAAIYDSANGPGVWSFNNHSGTVNFRPVHVERIGNETALLATGVQPGETIVALGASQLHEGEPVRLEAGVTTP
jgi:RND family efflux transporter MFP subunit